MPGGPLQEREHREVAVGIGGYEHVEVVAEEIAFPVGIPSPVAVRLGIMALAVAGVTPFLLAVAEALPALLCGQACRHQQGPDGPGRPGLCGRTDPRTAACRAGR